MTIWGVTAGCLMVVASVAACSRDGASAPTITTMTHRATTSGSAPERPTSTTTTTYAPGSVEGQVEAAYLKSWDVYADAVYNLHLDEAALAEVYADPYLSTVRSEIQRRIQEGNASQVDIDQRYSVHVVDATTASIVDQYRNHQVRVDPETKVRVEQDPDEEITDLVTLHLIGGAWRVVRIEELK